jgi:hypothetical protein
MLSASLSPLRFLFIALNQMRPLWPRVGLDQHLQGTIRIVEIGNDISSGSTHR